MKKRILFFILLILICSSLIVYSRGSLRVGVKIDISPAVIQSLETSEKANVVIVLEEDVDPDDLESDEDIVLGRQRHNMVTASITQEGIRKLESTNKVKAIVENLRVHAFLDASSPLINSDDVYPVQLSNYNITGQHESICVIDTGIDTDHTDIQNNIVAQYCVCDDDNFTDAVGLCPGGGWNGSSAEDDEGHGTHVSGIIASQNSAYKGVAHGANIIAVKALDSSGAGWVFDIQDAMAWCLNHSLEYNISVISMSLGGSAYYSSYCDSSNYWDGIYSSYINQSIAKNITVVVATGNSGNTSGISSPSCIKNAIRVGSVYDADVGSICFGGGCSTCTDSTTEADNISCFTDRSSTFPDILFAPGSIITSLNMGGGTTTSSGTSQATPHVSAAIALLKQFNKLQSNPPLDNNTYIWSTFNSTGTLVDDTLGSGIGFARIDILAALQSIDETAPTINFTAPTPPTNNTLTSNSSIEVNVSVVDSLNNISSCWLEWNSLTNYSMQQIINGTTSICYINHSYTLSNATYKVYANDSENNLAVSETRMNTIPTISDVILNSTDPLNRSNSTLTAYWTYSDSENSIAQLNHTKWYINQSEQSSLENLTIINQGNISKTDVWLFSIRAYDGNNWSSWQNSSNITINNAAPIMSVIKNESHVNETNLINITMNGSDIDNDDLVYDINDTRFTKATNSFTFQTNLSSSDSFTVKVNLTDGTATTYTDFSIIIYDLEDIDNDGNPDAINDTDDDNDGIADVNDTLTGNLSYINSSGIENLSLTINGSVILNQTFNNTLPINITDGNTTIVEFDWNFTNSTLDLSDITINNTNVSNYAAVHIKGLNLTQNRTKTIYITHLNGNRICILDSSNADIEDISSSCDGTSEHSITCDGTQQGQYTCTATGTTYKITGLNHSALKEYTYTEPSDPPSGGSSSSGGGGGGAVAKTATSETIKLGRIEAGETKKAEFSATGLVVTDIEIKVIKKVTASSITAINMGESKSIATDAVEGEELSVYAYLKLTLGKISDNNLADAKISFKVPISYGFDAATVELRRYDGVNRLWNSVPTRLVTYDKDFNYFEADTPGFSIFAVVGKEIEEIEAPKKKEEPKKQEEPVKVTANVVAPTAEKEPIEPKPISPILPWIISSFIAIIIVSSLLLLLFVGRKKIIKIEEKIDSLILKGYPKEKIEKMLSKSYPKLQIKIAMNQVSQQFKKLDDYISLLFSQGHKKSEIKKKLIGTGWPKHYIEQRLKKL